MYKRWDGKWLSENFIKGVEEFIEFATKEDSYIHDAKLRCPCSNCKNRKFQDVDSIRDHLYRRGFLNNYYEWVCHGESFSDLMPLTSKSNPYRDMVIDVLDPTYGDFGGEVEDFEEDPHPDVRKLLDMLKDAEKPLYEGCNMSILEMASRIINLKSEYNLAYRCVEGFAALISDSFPDRSLMTRSFHDTQRVLEGLELPHEKIHTCVNGYMLFWRQSQCKNAFQPIPQDPRDLFNGDSGAPSTFPIS